jgi:hypothetical protein
MQTDRNTCTYVAGDADFGRQIKQMLFEVLWFLHSLLSAAVETRDLIDDPTNKQSNLLRGSARRRTVLVEWFRRFLWQLEYYIASFHFLSKSSFTTNVPFIRRYIINACKNASLNNLRITKWSWEVDWTKWCWKLTFWISNSRSSVGHLTIWRLQGSHVVFNRPDVFRWGGQVPNIQILCFCEFAQFCCQILE